MGAGITSQQRQDVIAAMDSNPRLARLFHGMVEAVQTASLEARSEEALVDAAAALPAPGTAPTVSMEQMKNELRAADCLYDNAKIWRQLGAGRVPKIPESVIREAYEKGGRVVLKCSSISTKANALQKAGDRVSFGVTAAQRRYTENVLKPEWIVVQSHIDGKTLGSPKRDVPPP